MIKLHDKETGTFIGELEDEQLQFLIDELEEEGLTDQDYYVSQDLLDLFEDLGGDKDLIKLLRNALGEREGMDVIWSQEKKP